MGGPSSPCVWLGCPDQGAVAVSGGGFRVTLVRGKKLASGEARRPPRKVDTWRGLSRCDLDLAKRCAALWSGGGVQ
ncbi:hypothetical protein MRX96_018230 [Rhipicephalus microplus]